MNSHKSCVRYMARYVNGHMRSSNIGPTELAKRTGLSDAEIRNIRDAKLKKVSMRLLNILVSGIKISGDENIQRIKESFEQLLKGESITCSIDEQIVYNQLDDNEEAMNGYMERVARQTFSYFDTGKRSSQEEPERIHKYGFVFEGKKVLIGSGT